MDRMELRLVPGFRSVWTWLRGQAPLLLPTIPLIAGLLYLGLVEGGIALGVGIALVVAERAFDDWQQARQRSRVLDDLEGATIQLHKDAQSLFEFLCGQQNEFLVWWKKREPWEVAYDRLVDAEAERLTLRYMRRVDRELAELDAFLEPMRSSEQHIHIGKGAGGFDGKVPDTVLSEGKRRATRLQGSAKRVLKRIGSDYLEELES